MQDTIDAQKDELDKKNRTIKELHRKSIVSTINILRGLNIPEQEIVMRICEQYQIDEAQVKKYL